MIDCRYFGNIYDKTKSQPVYFAHNDVVMFHLQTKEISRAAVKCLKQQIISLPRAAVVITELLGVKRYTNLIYTCFKSLATATARTTPEV